MIESKYFLIVSPQNDEYFSARFLGKVSKLLGERGLMFIGMYEYLRWIDNIVDETDLSTEKKIRFTVRQKALLNSREMNFPDSYGEARKILNLPWNYYSAEECESIRKLATNIIETIEFDAERSNLEGRSFLEVEEYSKKLLKSAIRLASVIINKRDLNLERKSFDQLMYAWFMLGNLMHFDKDLVAGFFHFPLKEDDINKLLKAGVEERKKIILDELLPPDKFDELKKKYLWQTLVNSFAFMQTDMPFWQKILNSTYSFQVALKHSRATFPEIDQKIIGSNVIH